MTKSTLAGLLLLSAAIGCRDHASRGNRSASARPHGETEVATYDFDRLRVFEANDPAHPLVIRRHLPLPERLAGLRFISVQPRKPAWKPGLSAKGYYFLAFDWTDVEWEHEDLQDQFSLVMREDGAIEASTYKTKITGRFDQARLQVLWDGTWYQAMKPSYGPEPCAESHSPLALAPIENGFEIDLTSDSRESKLFHYSNDSDRRDLTVETLGHSGGYSIFDYSVIVEGGCRTWRHRLPTSQGKTTLQIDVTPDRSEPIKASFDTTQSKMVCWGNAAFDALHRRYPGQRNVNGTNYCVYTLDIRAGAGPKSQPGSTVTIWPVFYADRQYLKLRQGAKQREPITFTTRAGKVDTALDPAVEEMKVGGWRRVDLREECAGVLHEAIPNLAAGEFIYMEFQLRAVQTRKSPREGGLPGAGSSGR